MSEVLFTCPVCKKGSIGLAKGLFGKTVCDECGTRFKKHYSGFDSYFLDKKPKHKNYTDKYEELSSRFATKCLKPQEWNKITTGGASDEEIGVKAENEFLEKIRKGDLSRVTELSNVPVMLKKNEIAYLHLQNIRLIEERTRRQFSGGSRGISVRVMKGVSFRVGAFKGESVPVTENKVLDTGDFVITNSRVIFSGTSKGVAFPITKIIGMEEWANAITITRTGKQRAEIFSARIELPEIKYTSPWSLVKAIIEGVFANT